MNIDPHGFWSNDTLEGHIFDKHLASALGELLNGFSVIDLGCGHGEYTKYLISCGIACDGYDGNPNTPQLTEGACKVLDLSQTVVLGKQYDYVLSLEVGEHIPAQYEWIFINNLHRLNRKGVILSWAVEGQGGAGHFNEHNNDYIRHVFEALGYKPALEVEQKLRGATTLPWFKNTIMVFNKN